MAEKKKITFILNPISGTQGKEQILKLIPEKLDTSLYDYDIIKTEYAGHAVVLARVTLPWWPSAVTAR